MCPCTQEYIFKGYVVGAFYNQDGKPNRILRRAEEQAVKAKSEEEAMAEIERQWPACNVRWSEAEGAVAGRREHKRRKHAGQCTLHVCHERVTCWAKYL